VRRFGWSMISAEDAAALVEHRADEVIGRIVAGAKIPRWEPEVPYNGAQGVPIREEVLQRQGDDGTLGSRGIGVRSCLLPQPTERLGSGLAFCLNRIFLRAAHT